MLTISLIILTSLVCIYAAFTDVKRLEIDNWISLAVIGLFIIYGLTSPVIWLAHVLVMIVILIFGLVLMKTDVMGGGDVKLITALSLWAGVQHLPLLLISISIAGAVAALVTIGLQKTTIIKKDTGLAWIDQARAGGSKVAYGVAIAIGACITLIHIGGV